MVVSKWSLDFRANHELAVIPVWASFLDLSLPLFAKNQLGKLAAMLGRPLRVDVATSTLRRPSVARVLVEVDVSKEPMKRVWMGVMSLVSGSRWSSRTGPIIVHSVHRLVIKRKSAFGSTLP